jgi:hypothetical protein
VLMPLALLSSTTSTRPSSSRLTSSTYRMPRLARAWRRRGGAFVRACVCVCGGGGGGGGRYMCVCAFPALVQSQSRPQQPCCCGCGCGCCCCAPHCACNAAPRSLSSAAAQHTCTPPN